MNNSNLKWSYILMALLMTTVLSLGILLGVILTQKKQITQEVNIVSEMREIEKDNKYKINLNTAKQSDLEKLPTIGFVKSKAIISYRESNGIFKNINDLLAIDGITENNIKSIQNLVEVK